MTHGLNGKTSRPVSCNIELPSTQLYVGMLFSKKKMLKCLMVGGIIYVLLLNLDEQFFLKQKINKK